MSLPSGGDTLLGQLVWILLAHHRSPAKFKHAVHLSNIYATGQLLPLLPPRCLIPAVLPSPFYLFQEFRLLFLIGRSEDYLTLFVKKMSLPPIGNRSGERRMNPAEG